jgi:AcrR family transcriptional regulator
VTENAGCTKGALYDHFGSKDRLFLALLDQQFAGRIEQAEQAGSQPPSEAMPFDREFALLFLEFVCAAAREPKVRRRLAARLHELRSHTAARVGEPQGTATFDGSSHRYSGAPQKPPEPRTAPAALDSDTV